MSGIAAYVRVSTVGQNEAGQRAGIERWLTGNDIELADVAWYVDKESGDTLQRRAFQKLQEAIFSGEVHTVVVWRLDRLSRKLRDGINVMGDWCERGLRVVSVTQQIDFNGTVGQIIASVLMGIGQMEQEARRERQRAGITVARSRGKYPGRKNGTTKARPERARELRTRGLNDSEIATALGVSRRSVQRYLKSAGG